MKFVGVRGSLVRTLFWGLGFFVHSHELWVFLSSSSSNRVVGCLNIIVDKKTETVLNGLVYYTVLYRLFEIVQNKRRCMYTFIRALYLYTVPYTVIWLSNQNSEISFGPQLFKGNNFVEDTFGSM